MRIRPLSAALFLCVYHAAVVLFAADIPVITRVSPISRFQFDEVVARHGGGNTAIRQFAATEKGLLFLTADSVVTRVDPSGEFMGRIQHSPGTEITRFTVDREGSLYIAEIDRAKETRIVRDPVRNNVVSRGIQKFPRAMCHVGSVVWELTDAGVLHPLNREKPDIPAEIFLPRLGPHVEMAALNSTQVIVSDGANARLFLADTALNQVREIPVEAPELSSARELADKFNDRYGGTSIILSGLAVSPEGHLFTHVSYLPVAEGAVVLELTPDGALIKRLHLQLPADANVVTNLGVTKDNLFVTSGRAVFTFSR